MLTLSIAANFGLCRKKNAGTSVRDPLSGTSMFCEQEMVDEFILSSTSRQLLTKLIDACSEHTHNCNCAYL